MCGIFGIVSAKQQRLGTILVGAGKRLSYRGYDSVGCATLSRNGSIDLRKDVGKVQDVASRYNLEEMQGFRGIVQLRWATFGKPSKVNAQPHFRATFILSDAAQVTTLVYWAQFTAHDWPIALRFQYWRLNSLRSTGPLSRPTMWAFL